MIEHTQPSACTVSTISNTLPAVLAVESRGTTWSVQGQLPSHHSTCNRLDFKGQPIWPALVEEFKSR